MWVEAVARPATRLFEVFDPAVIFLPAYPLQRWADRCVLVGVLAFSARRLWRERWLH